MNTPISEKACAYEMSREQRIKENRERMQKLGISDLSANLNSLCSFKRIKKPSHHKPKPHLSSQPTPVRRSSRLQNVTPISYSEVLPGSEGLKEEDVSLRGERGSMPEVYTEEHEKLLGSTERSWTLFVDGCGKDGKRIYDSFKGKTCHQCRQKTLGHRTHCSRCNMVQGQFCGDCLYMRYGEHVLEAVENPDWLCPVCRGICNCSLCRQSRGWAATGALYKKVTKLGYKSVAHYLIQTRRAQKNADDNVDSATQGSAKRALAFLDMANSTESEKPNKLDSESLKLESEDQVSGMFGNEIEGKSYLGSANQVSVKRSLMLSDIEASSEKLKSAVTENEANFHLGLLKPQPEDPKDTGFKSEVHSNDGGKGGNDESSGRTSTIADDNALQGSPNLKKKRAFAVEPSPDSIAGRLRQRRRTTDA